MAQLNLDDEFLVQRKNKTYKATFEDIEESLNLEHDFTAEVLSTPGGTVNELDIVVRGTDFLESESYTAVNGTESIEFIAVEVHADGGLKTVQVLTNDPTQEFEVFVANPIKDDGVLKTVTINVPPGLTDGSSTIYAIRQEITTGVYNSSGVVNVTNNGGSFTAEIVARGSNYSATKPAYLEYSDAGGVQSEGPLVTITVDTIANGVSRSASLQVSDIEDGANSDKAELIVTLGDTEKKVYLVPGEGISLTNGLLDNEIVINNLLNQIDGNTGGGNNSSMGATVIVNEYAPALDVYPMIQDGTLWYNLIDGRLYVAVTYQSATSAGLQFQWIDASPASFNDSLRKNQDDETFYNISVSKNSSVNPGGGTLYAYHYDLESLPLIS